MQPYLIGALLARVPPEQLLWRVPAGAVAREDPGGRLGGQVLFDRLLGEAVGQRACSWSVLSRRVGCVGGELTSGGRIRLPSSASEGREAVGWFGGEAVVWARGAGVLESALVWGESALCPEASTSAVGTAMPGRGKIQARSRQEGVGEVGAARRTAKLAVARLVESAHLRHACGGPSSGGSRSKVLVRVFVGRVCVRSVNGRRAGCPGFPGWVVWVLRKESLAQFETLGAEIIWEVEGGSRCWGRLTPAELQWVAW